MARDFTTDKIVLAVESNLDFDRLDPYSYMLGIKTGQTSVGAMVSKVAVTTLRGWELVLVSGKPRWQLISDSPPKDQLRLDTTNTVNDDAIHIILFTYSGSGTAAGVKGYIDGATETMIEVGGDTFANTTLNNVAMELGHRSTGGLDYEDMLSFFVVWDAELSASEAQALTRGVNPFGVRPANLKAFLPIWGNQSPEPDYHKASSTGTVTGTTKVANPPVQLLQMYMP